MPEIKENFDKEKYAAERKQEMEDIAAKLEKGVAEVFNGENYKNYLKFCAKLPRYSINNQLLIMMQNPDATMCQSFSGWKDAGRNVKKGEKGIRILAPAPYNKEVERQKMDESGKPVFDANGDPVNENVTIKVNAFKVVSTFDIEQTEGEPVPTLAVDELTQSVNGYEILMDAVKQAVDVPITFESITNGAKGYYSIEENRIAINEGMSEAQTVKTLLHEISHATLHSKEAMKKNAEEKSKNQKETEAESIAYVVCQHYGIDTSDYSFGYVATWASDKESNELKMSLDTIRRCASDLIVKIDEKIADITQFKSVSKAIEAMDDEIPFDLPEQIPVEPAKDSAPEKKENKKESVKKKLEAKKKEVKKAEPSKKNNRLEQSI